MRSLRCIFFPQRVSGLSGRFFRLCHLVAQHNTDISLTSDLDIYRSANELIEQHGEDAPIEAAMRADELAADGDM